MQVHRVSRTIQRSIQEPTNALCNRTNAQWPNKRGTATSKQRGTYTTWHYALLEDYSVIPYLSNEFLKDGIEATEWAKVNKPLFNYLAKELRFCDPATFAQMKRTPWLDNIIRHGGINLG